METDAIRASGNETVVDIWIDGKMRAVCVSRGAIDAYLELPQDKAAAMSDEERCEFVRNNLTLIIKEAKRRLAENGPGADTVTIDAGQLRRQPAGSRPERRKSDRRKGERRKADRPAAIPPQGDRRRGDRRRGERRARPKDADNS